MPPLPPCPQTPGAQGAWAAESGARWRRQRFSTHSSHRGPGGLCRSALKGEPEAHTASREPPPLTLRPALPSPPPALRAELRLPRGPRTDRLLEPLTHTPFPVHAGITDFFRLLLLRLVLFSAHCPPPLQPPARARFPSESGGWRRAKKKPVLKGAVRTDLSAAEEDPRSGRALQRVGALERRARAERRQRSARCPSGRSAPPPPSAQRSPPQRRGPGNPPARFFVQFQQSSEEVGPFVPLFIDCVNIAKRRRRSGGPSPAPRPAPWREKPQHTT